MKHHTKYGTYDSQLDQITQSLQIDAAFVWDKPAGLVFHLSEYSGSTDVLYDIPGAMEEFSPHDSDAIHISEIDEKRDLFEKICHKYHHEMEIIRKQRLRQAMTRAQQIIRRIFKSEEDIYVMLQSPRCLFQTGMKVMLSSLMGQKQCSHIFPMTNLYVPDSEQPAGGHAIRILYRHSFSKLRLKYFLKNIIYGKGGLGEIDSDSIEFYLISPENPDIILSIYDDSRLSVSGPAELIQDLEITFEPWVRDRIGN